MANTHVREQKQRVVIYENVLPKPKPRSSNNAASQDENRYTPLRTIQRIDNAYESLHFDTELQPQESKTTPASYKVSEQVADRGNTKLPESEGGEANEEEGNLPTGSQAKEEKNSKNMKMWKLYSSKWRMVTFVALITFFSLVSLLLVAIAAVGLSRANSAAESNQELQLMVQQLEERADDMQKEINKTMATLDSALHQISTAVNNLSQLRNDIHTLSEYVVANQNDIQALKTDTSELFTSTDYLKNTSEHLLTTVDRLNSTIISSEMTIRALNSTFQDHVTRAETLFSDLNSAIDSLAIQPCQPTEEMIMNSTTFHFLNNANATSTVLISTQPMQVNRTVS